MDINLEKIMLSEPAMNQLMVEARAEADRRTSNVARAGRYVAQGTCLKMQTMIDPEIIVSGAAGTGKTRAWLEFLVRHLETYKGARVLIIRKTRTSCTESVLKTLERDVFGENHYLVTTGPTRQNRLSYIFNNGSELVVGGLDKPTRILSTEYDIIYVPEVIEITESEWETLSTRLRNHVIPYQMIIGDTNPGSPRNWIPKREKRGILTLIYSTHEDNPVLYNLKTGQWTKKGLQYLARLDKLSGSRYQRFRLGKWVQSEGVVYTDWNPAIHVIDRFDIPKHWARYRSIDFGFTNPFVCTWWAIDEDGRMYCYREIYQAQKLVSNHAKDIKIYPDHEDIMQTVCDWDAEDKATLAAEGIPSINADKTVKRGIELVKKRLQVAGDDKPRIFFFRDALVTPVSEDTFNIQNTTCTLDEFDIWSWSSKDEVPMRGDDHGLDTVRYMVVYLEGQGVPEDYLIRPW